jgi:hypothetical protein
MICVVWVLRSWSVPSQSRPGVEYTVSVDDGGMWSCTCPHYTYRHTICKHIVMVQTELSAPKPKYVVHPIIHELDPHPNKNAHKIFAKIIYDFIIAYNISR